MTLSAPSGARRETEKASSLKSRPQTRERRTPARGPMIRIFGAAMRNDRTRDGRPVCARGFQAGDHRGLRAGPDVEEHQVLAQPVCGQILQDRTCADSRHRRMEGASDPLRGVVALYENLSPRCGIRHGDRVVGLFQLILYGLFERSVHVDQERGVRLRGHVCRQPAETDGFSQCGAAPARGDPADGFEGTIAGECIKGQPRASGTGSPISMGRNQRDPAASPDLTTRRASRTPSLRRGRWHRRRCCGRDRCG